MTLVTGRDRGPEVRNDFGARFLARYGGKGEGEKGGKGERRIGGEGKRGERQAGRRAVGRLGLRGLGHGVRSPAQQIGLMDHRSLEAWKIARELTLAELAACRYNWQPWAAALFGQLQRAALSVELNIAEGYSFGPSRTYTRHLGIAYGSAVEAGELLCLATESEALPGEVARPMLEKSDRCRRLLLGLLKRRRPIQRQKGKGRMGERGNCE